MKRLSTIVVCIVALLFVSCQPEIQERQIIQSLIWVGTLDQHPANPEMGWAYYNSVDGCSYVYTDSGWQVIAQDGIGIQWKGELYSTPANPQKNWAYFNVIDGNSYIYNGTSWDYLAKSGRDGASGILKWLGNLPSAPVNPTDGDAYHDTGKNASFIYSNGNWSVLAEDGIDSTFNWLGELTAHPNNPSSGDAYYNTTDNTAYIYNDTTWGILVENTSNYYSVPFSWKGELTQAPSSPQVGWMYYNITIGASYIWDGSTWQQIAKDGYSPTGFLIQWKGTLETHPKNPEQGWAYYNLSANASFLFDGTNWTIMSQSGTSSIATYVVRYNGKNVSYGDVIDMGTIPEGQWAPIVGTISIENTGSETIFFPDGVATTAYYGIFDLEETALPKQLAPGEVCELTVRYSTEYGSQNNLASQLNITLFSSAIVNPFTFQLTARSFNPAFSLSWNGKQVLLSSQAYFSAIHYDTEFEFGDIESGQTISIIFYCSREPSKEYDIAIEGTDRDCFHLSVTTANQLSISVASKELGMKEAELVISNEDFRYSVPLKANIITPGEIDESGFSYEKFINDVVLYDGGEGDGDDYCYFAMADGADGYYFFGTAYERVGYSSGDDFWIIHAANDGSIISEQLFDQVPSDMYFLGGKLMEDGSIVLVSDDYAYTIPPEADSYSSYRIDADKPLEFTNDSFFVSYNSNIYEYSFTGSKLGTINVSNYISSIADMVIYDDFMFVGGYKSNAVAADSADDAIILKLDMTSETVLNAIQIDEAHGDDDDVTSLLILDDILYVTGTSYDLISSRSEVDGWLRAYDISDMTELENLYYETDSALGTLFSHDNKLMDWSTWRIGRYDITDKVEYSSTSLSWSYPYYQRNSVPMISNGEFLIPGYANEGATEAKNGIDWAIKRFYIDELF